MRNAKLKKIPNDFIVTECSTLPHQSCIENHYYYYYTMQKCGYSTFDAIRILSNITGINKENIGYAGLKDEDGITEQIISLTEEIPSEIVTELYELCAKDKQKYIYLQYKGRGELPIQIGNLLGNTFQITVRMLSKEIVNELRNLQKTQLFFLNYYDTQRFGIPNYPQVAHKIGEKLLSKDYDNALKLFLVSGNEETSDYDVNQSAKSFFDTLDIRKQTFFMNAFSSFQWNQRLGEILFEVFEHRVKSSLDEGIPFYYLEEQEKLIELLKHYPSLEFIKHKSEGGKIFDRISSRPTVIQTFIENIKVDKDELYSDSLKMTVSFYLPSGCYATMAIKQWIFFLQKNKKERMR
ncbi:tRNA pseudouridine(13) synthase TruD [Siminovitchia sediminis]|uniref:tRNA pseudouridine(13) synthase TruD n=1 Tax=Siminovitchia sediminis TaxID=1274353 RepID=A0ABW4KN77_9BACI